MGDNKLDEYSKKFIQHMGKSLFEGLQESIPQILEAFIEQRFKGITKALEPVVKMEEEQREQGKDIENLKIAYQHQEIETKKIRELIIDLTKKLEEVNKTSVTNAVNDAVAEAVPQAVSETFEVVNKKVTVIEKPKRKWFIWF